MNRFDMCWFGVSTFNIVRCPSLIRFHCWVFLDIFSRNSFAYTRLNSTFHEVGWERVRHGNPSSELSNHLNYVQILTLACIFACVWNWTECEATLVPFGWLFVFVINSGSSHRKRSKRQPSTTKVVVFIETYYECITSVSRRDVSSMTMRPTTLNFIILIIWLSSLCPLPEIVTSFTCNVLRLTHTTRMIGKKIFSPRSDRTIKTVHSLGLILFLFVLLVFVNACDGDPLNARGCRHKKNTQIINVKQIELCVFLLSLQVATK